MIPLFFLLSSWDYRCAPPYSALEISILKECPQGWRDSCGQMRLGGIWRASIPENFTLRLGKLRKMKSLIQQQLLAAAKQRLEFKSWAVKKSDAWSSHLLTVTLAVCPSCSREFIVKRPRPQGGGDACRFLRLCSWPKCWR
jgi:hypothetical protein